MEFVYKITSEKLNSGIGFYIQKSKRLVILLILSFFINSISLQAQNYPSSGSNISLSGSSASWGDFNTIYTDNGDYAFVQLNNSNYSNYLYASGFDFSIPSNSIINSITVSIDRTAYADYSPQNLIRDYDVRLVKSGSIVGNNYAQSSSTYWAKYSNVETVNYTGGGSALWGTFRFVSCININCL